MSTILITGSAGFIGFNLAKKLLLEGHSVIGIDNENSDYDPKIKMARTKELKKFSNFTFLKEDILNENILKKIKDKNVKYFIHLAARDLYYNSADNLNYIPYLETNVIGAAKMFELAKSLSAKKFILASTHSVYGNTKKGIVTEKKIVPDPISPHGASKLAAENVIRYMSHLFNIPAISLRIFSVYGPGMAPHTFIPKAVDAIKSGKKLQGYTNISNIYRDLIYIDDVVNYIHAAIKTRVKYQTINIATGESVSYAKLVLMIAKILKLPTPKTLSFKKGSPLSRMIIDKIEADPSRAKKILGYVPQTNFEEGLRKTVEYFSKQK